MNIPELPKDLQAAKEERERSLRLELHSQVKAQVFAHLFPGGFMGTLDNALGIDKKAILKEVLIELAGMMDKYTIAELDENIH